MINLWKKDDLNLLSEYPKEVIENVDNIITILDESYGDNRKSTDDGGYICIVETLEEVIKIKDEILKGLLYEFSDLIYKDEELVYHSTLYMLSNDYSLTVVTKNELTEKLITL